MHASCFYILHGNTISLWYVLNNQIFLVMEPYQDQVLWLFRVLFSPVNDAPMGYNSYQALSFPQMASHRMVTRNSWSCWNELLLHGPLHYHELTLIPEWMSNYSHHKMCDEIT